MTLHGLSEAILTGPCDVVFLGEQHDNDAGHRQHYRLIRMLHAERPDLVISMEMFERDVQGQLDAYLAGEIEEEEFLETARPWGNYKRDYRPVIEFAKAYGLRVIAANAPAALATAVRKGEVGLGDQSQPFMPTVTTAPKDDYWKMFVEVMKSHPGFSEATLDLYYAAQCLRDDSMAEAIAGVVHDTSLVAHICGQLHAANGLGTVSRLEALVPGVQCTIVTMETAPRVRRLSAREFQILVPPEPPRVATPLPESGDAGLTDDPPRAPGLGVRLDYGAVDGMPIMELVPGGAAEAAGLKAGDVIVRVGEVEVFDISSYMEALGTLTPGEVATVHIDRGGENLQIKVTVGSR